MGSATFTGAASAVSAASAVATIAAATVRRAEIIPNHNPIAGVRLSRLGCFPPRGNAPGCRSIGGERVISGERLVAGGEVRHMTEGEVGLGRLSRPTRVRLAWRILTHDKARTVLAIAGVFMAILLIFVELGFFFAVPQGGMLFYDNLQFDLLMSSNQYEYQAQPGQFPRGQLERARSAPEVAQATPLYFGSAKWRDGEDGKAPDIFVIGLDPRRPIFEADSLNRELGMIERPDV